MGELDRSLHTTAAAATTGGAWSTPAADAYRGEPRDVDYSWKRVDIYWANAALDDSASAWEIDDFHTPQYEKLDIAGEFAQRAPDGVSAKFVTHLRTDKVSGVPSPGDTKSAVTDEVEKSQSDDAMRQAMQNLVGRAEKVLESGKVAGAICTEVSQWVIIEAQTYKPIVKDKPDTYPVLHIWGFLQPLYIGNSESMKENFGYVIDDIPRAGWGEMKLTWRTDDETGAVSPSLVRVKTVFDTLGNTSVTEVPLESVAFRFPDSAEENYRVQVKVKLTIRNEETVGDRARKNVAFMGEVRRKLAAAGKQDQEIEEQLRKVDRFECGSYVKGWVRNLAYRWERPDGGPSTVLDDETEECMRTMDTCDRPHDLGAFIFRNYPVTPEKGEKEMFRPMSFRNHMWKRNRITINKNGDQSTEAAFIALLPEEVIERIATLFAPSKAEVEESQWLRNVVVPLVYVLLIVLLKKAKDQANKKEAFQKVVDALNLPQFAAIMATIGMPDSLEEFQKKSKAFSALFGDP